MDVMVPVSSTNTFTLDGSTISGNVSGAALKSCSASTGAWSALVSALGSGLLKAPCRVAVGILVESSMFFPLYAL